MQTEYGFHLRVIFDSRSAVSTYQVVVWDVFPGKQPSLYSAMLEGFNLRGLNHESLARLASSSLDFTEVHVLEPLDD
jgi:hypothetical protein